MLPPVRKRRPMAQIDSSETQTFADQAEPLSAQCITSAATPDCAARTFTS